MNAPPYRTGTDFRTASIDYVSNVACDTYVINGTEEPWAFFSPLAPTKASRAKLHVSAHEWTAWSILEEALRVLVVHCARFKVATNTRVLGQLNAGRRGVSQIGKFITIYPNSLQEAVDLGLLLHSATVGLHGPAISGEASFGQRSVVFLRVSDEADKTLLLRDAELFSVPLPPRTINNRYVIPEWFRNSATGYVAVGLDLTNRVSVLAKAARIDDQRSPGVTMRDCYKHELEILGRLVGINVSPHPREYLETDGHAILVMEDVGGESLELAARDKSRDPLAIVGGAIRALDKIHSQGVVHGDISPTNVIYGAGNRVHIIDYETSTLVGHPYPSSGCTVGYSSPWRVSERAKISDDIYSMAALSYFAFTRRNPGPGFPSDLRLRAATCPRLAADWIEAATQQSSDINLSTYNIEAMNSSPLDSAVPRHSRHLGDLVDKIAYSLAQAALEMLKEPRSQFTQLSDLGLGWGGVLWALCEAAGSCRDEHCPLDVIDRLARKVAALSTSRELDGICGGPAGKALSLARASSVLDLEYLRSAAQEYLEQTTDCECSDVFGGMAGQIQAALRCAELLADKRSLRRAKTKGKLLLETVSSRLMSDGRKSARVELGYAHGLAGIGDTFLDLYLALEDEVWLEPVRKIVSLLSSTVEVADNGRCAWPGAVGEGEVAPRWCHGAGGIAQFMQRAGKILGSAPLIELAKAGARATADAAVSAEYGQCHGISGAIEVVLDALAEDSDNALRSTLARLQGLLVNVGDNNLLGGDVTILNGTAGVLLCLLRIQSHSLGIARSSTLRFRATSTRS